MRRQHNLDCEKLQGYCLAPEYTAKAGLGDRLNILADLLNRGIAFNKANFVDIGGHKNANADFLFQDSPDSNVYLWYFYGNPPFEYELRRQECKNYVPF